MLATSYGFHAGYKNEHRCFGASLPMRILHHGRDQLLDPTAYKGVATMPPEAGSASCLGQYQSSQMELIEAEPGSRAEPDAPEPCRRTRAGQGMAWKMTRLGARLGDGHP